MAKAKNLKRPPKGGPKQWRRRRLRRQGSAETQLAVDAFLHLGTGKSFQPQPDTGVYRARREI